MKKLVLNDLMNIFDYERVRDDYRKEMIEYKKSRRVNLGPHITITFENRKTMKFQIQEMMRAERMVHDHQIQTELNVYNPLLPGDKELSATLFIEIIEPEHIRPVLDNFIGLTNSDRVFLLVGGKKICAQFEDGREKEDNISSVHYIRFIFDNKSRQAFENTGTKIELVINHKDYYYSDFITGRTRETLLADLS